MTTTPAQQKWILIAEDDGDLSEALEGALSKSGYRVLKSGSVPDLTAKLARQVFDCVLLDVQLEKGSGDQVLAYMRRPKTFNEHTPCIVMSGFLDKDLVKKLVGLTPHILVKPFDMKAQISKIEQVTAKKAA